MLEKWLYDYTARRPTKLIKPDGRLYKERSFLCEFRIGGLEVYCYLHRFVGEDADRGQHDHPWDWSVGIPLTGPYEENVLVAFDPDTGPITRAVTRRRFIPNFIGKKKFHQIVRVRRGTYTFFVHGRWVKGWGFLEWAPPRIVYERHGKGTDDARWWETAPVGADVGREPFEEPIELLLPQKKEPKSGGLSQDVIKDPPALASGRRRRFG